MLRKKNLCCCIYGRLFYPEVVYKDTKQIDFRRRVYWLISKSLLIFFSKVIKKVLKWSSRVPNRHCLLVSLHRKARHLTRQLTRELKIFFDSQLPYVYAVQSQFTPKNAQRFAQRFAAAASAHSSFRLYVPAPHSRLVAPFVPISAPLAPKLDTQSTSASKMKFRALFIRRAK